MISVSSSLLMSMKYVLVCPHLNHKEGRIRNVFQTWVTMCMNLIRFLQESWLDLLVFSNVPQVILARIIQWSWMNLAWFQQWSCINLIKFCMIPAKILHESQQIHARIFNELAGFLTFLKWFWQESFVNLAWF